MSNLKVANDLSYPKRGQKETETLKKDLLQQLNQTTVIMQFLADDVNHLARAINEEFSLTALKNLKSLGKKRLRSYEKLVGVKVL